MVAWLSLTTAVALLGGQDPNAEKAQRIAERMNEVFDSFRTEVRRGLHYLLEQELSRYRHVAADDPDLARIREIASRMADDEQHRTIREALLNPGAQRELVRQLRALRLTPDQAAERFFEEGPDGRLRVRPEHRQMLESIARAYAMPGPAPRPTPRPAPTPPQAGRAYYGIRIAPEFDDARRRELGVPEGMGVLVLEAVENSPAAQAGLRDGDVILRIGGEPATPVNFGRLLTQHGPGERVAFVVWRDRQEQEIVVTVGSR
jgi:hypothetical protein